MLLPVRNAADYLDQALASLAGQTLRDFEIIAVDNGSTDGSADILGRWAGHEPRLRVLKLDRPGISASLNLAAANARAPFLARLDADDIALPCRLAAQMEAMSRSPALGLLGSCAELVDHRNRRIGAVDRPLGDSELRALLRSANGFVHSSVMIRASVFRAAGGYRNGLVSAQDFDLWLRIAEISEIANLPQRLIRYRAHRTSGSARMPARQAIASVCVIGAGEARRLGKPEPFANGVPMLRSAVPLLGIPPLDIQNRIRLTVARARVLQHFMALPLPAGLKAGFRAAALGLGLRGPYLRIMRMVTAIRRARPER